MKTLPNDIVVVGAGGHAKVVIATIRAAGGDVTVAYDDDEALWGGRVLGVAVEQPPPKQALAGVPAIVAIGSNKTRQTIARQWPARWVTAVHPTAVVHPSVSVGPGSVVFAGSVIQPDVVIGAHAIINTAVSVDHDCIVGDFVHLGPGVRLCGGVTVDEGVLVGVGANVAPNVAVGPWSIAGAGSVCVANVAGGTTVVGVPARPRRKDR